MEKQSLELRTVNEEPDYETQTKGNRNIRPVDDLSEIELIVNVAEAHSDLMHLEQIQDNPHQLNYNAAKRIVKKTLSFAGNTAKCLISWPYLVKRIAETSSDSSEYVETILFGSVLGVTVTVGLSTISAYNYQVGNIGIIPALAMNIPLFGAGIPALNLIGRAAKLWFKYERDTVLETYEKKADQSRAYLKELNDKGQLPEEFSLDDDSKQNGR